MLKHVLSVLSLMALLASPGAATESSSSDLNIRASQILIDEVAGTITPTIDLYFTDILNQTSTTFDVELRKNGELLETYTVTYVVTNASSDCEQFGDPQSQPACQGGCGKNGNQFLACMKVNKGMNAYECACNGKGELPPHDSIFEELDEIMVTVDSADDHDEWDEADNVTTVIIP